MDVLRIVRFVLFGLVLLFALVELGLCANDLRVTKGGVFIDTGNEVLLLSPFFFPFAAFGLAISVLTIVFVLPIIIIDVLQKGALTSVIAVELIWTGIFWVLWLAVGAVATAAGVFKECNFADSKVEMICRQFPAIQGLAFFNWLLLFGWWITLWVMVFLLRRKQADNQNNKSMWRQSVAEARMSISAPIPQDGAHNTRYGIQPHGTDNIAMKRTEHPVKETQGSVSKGGSLYDRFRSRSGVNAV